MTISMNDPLLRSVLTEIDAGNPAFGSDVINLINRSPTMVAEIEQADAQPDVSGGQTAVQLQNDPSQGASSYYRSDTIEFSALSTYQDKALPYAGGSLTASYDLVTPASVFVGEIGYELGHVLDPTLGPIYDDGLYDRYSVDQAVLTEFASEGTSSYDESRIKAQIDASLPGDPVPSTMANGLGFFNPAGNLSKDTSELRLLQTIHDEGQAKSDLASQFWNTPVNGGTFLSTYWNPYLAAGSRNYLGINEASVTGVSVRENAGGVLLGGTITTTTDSYDLTFNGIGQETAGVTHLRGDLLYTDAFSDVAGTPYGLTRTQSGASFTTDPDAIETVVGNGNGLTDTANGITVRGSANTVSAVAQGDDVALVGDGNVVFSTADTTGLLDISLTGAANEMVLGGNATTVSGAGADSTVFGGSGGLAWNAGGGTLVLSGPSTIAGAATDQTVFSSGRAVYAGGTGYADFIGSAGSATIGAAQGGGWFEGGSAGKNLIQGSNSGIGTVLDAGGDDDTIAGGTNGGDYFVAGAGNETLVGGNTIGTNYFFLGSGFDAVTLSGNSILDTGSGYADIVGSGQAQVYGGSGAGDTFTATSGTMDIYGYRPGIDHISGAIASTSHDGGSTVLRLADGAVITLHGSALA